MSDTAVGVVDVIEPLACSPIADISDCLDEITAQIIINNHFGISRMSVLVAKCSGG